MPDDLSADLASLRIDRDAPPGHGGRSLAVVVVVTTVVAIGYFVMLPYLESKVFKTEVEMSVITLVSPSQAAVELTSTGYVEARTVSNVSARVAGTVSEVYVRQGQHIKAGEPLYALDVADQKASIAAAVSQVAAASARAQTTRANLAEIQLQESRASKLAQQGVRPEAVAEDLGARLKSATQQVRAADAEVVAAQANVKALRVNLENYHLTAPISGTVVSKPPQTGEFVGPQSLAGGGGIVEIADFSTLVIETDVPEGRLHMVKLEGPTEIVLDAFPGKRFRGKTVEIVPQVNRAKATVPVKVAFADEAPGVLPDMSARVSFLAGEIDAAAIKEPPRLIVPTAAVIDRDGAKLVFVVEADVVRMTPVSIGGPASGGLELLSGPAAGTRVVVHPPATLSDGQKVKTKESP